MSLNTKIYGFPSKVMLHNKKSKFSYCSTPVGFRPMFC